MSLIRPAPEPIHRNEQAHVDLHPWRHANTASAVIVALTLAFYIALAQ
jgi:uncharacterized sodium:solute symporter family permease YidK